jgi:hypothetical protein
MPLNFMLCFPLASSYMAPSMPLFHAPFPQLKDAW